MRLLKKAARPLKAEHPALERYQVHRAVLEADLPVVAEAPLVDMQEEGLERAAVRDDQNVPGFSLKRADFVLPEIGGAGKRRRERLGTVARLVFSGASKKSSNHESSFLRFLSSGVVPSALPNDNSIMRSSVLIAPRGKPLIISAVASARRSGLEYTMSNDIPALRSPSPVFRACSIPVAFNAMSVRP